MLHVGVPVLGGAAEERIFQSAEPAGISGAFSLYRAGDWLLGCAARPVGAGGIEAATRTLYADLLTAVRGRHLCRVWNYLPQINAHKNGLENYRAFCRERALAFEGEFGMAHHSRLCAASAVGTGDERLAVIFAASATAPRHVENPAQVSAYRYPPEHGTHAPSFARATVTADGRTVFVSGTAAITGHSTIAPGDTDAQVGHTLNNLALISRAAGLGAELGAGANWTRHFKIYLRHAEDHTAVAARLQAALLRPDDHVVWLQSDICRAALNVEIEATLVAK